MILALKAIYRDKSIKYQVSVSDVDFLIDRQDCLELIGNLLDNASKWAKQQVRLEIEQEVNGFFLRVEDDGPGCSDAEIKILSQPGMWLNEKNAGHGLGMSLMHNIAKLYGGTIHFGRSSLLGGLSVSVHLRSRTVDPITRKII